MNFLRVVYKVPVERPACLYRTYTHIHTHTYNHTHTHIQNHIKRQTDRHTQMLYS